MTNPSSVDQSVHPEADRWGGWSWREPIRGEHFRRCGYCGCVNPEDLVAEPAWIANWADMKYGWPHKFYVDIPNRDTDSLFVVASMSGGDNAGPRPSGTGEWVAWDDMTDQQREWAKRDGHPMHDGWHPAWIQFGKKPHHFGKFYTVHLRDAGLDPAVKEAIERRSGLVFEFTSDRVTWRPIASGSSG